jgi:hypothetical protein
MKDRSKPLPAESLERDAQVRQYLAMVFQHFQRTGDWPVLTELQRSAVRDGWVIDMYAVSSEVPPDWGSNPGRGGARPMLSAIGIAMCDKAATEVADFMGAIRLAAERYRSDSGLTLEDSDFADELGLDALRLTKLRRLLDWEPFFGISESEHKWSAEIRETIFYVLDVTTIDEFVAAKEALRAASLSPRRYAYPPEVGEALKDQAVPVEGREGILKDVETIKRLCLAAATGGDRDDLAYGEARAKLLQQGWVRPLLPGFVADRRDLWEFWGFIKSLFPTYQERRAYLVNAFAPLLGKLEESTWRSPAQLAADTLINASNSAEIQLAWQKALDRRASDPEGAITAARSLLESTCKHILDEGGVAYEDSEDLPALYRSVAKELDLAPAAHSEQVFKQILGGCQSVVEGLGALRNRHSDAHGKGKAAAKPGGRHAELAVNLAGSMADFLIATWNERTI